MYTTYILRTNENTLYIGQTNDLTNRLKLHRSGKGAKYLRRFGDFILVYKEQYKTRSEAMKREFELKKLTKSEKESLIRKPHA